MMPMAIGLFVYLIGLCVGSFLNVVVYRLPRGLSISNPTWSFCPHCKTTLRWYDNLPVLGWLLLRARCRYCRKPISAQYPLVEAVTGLVFVLTYYLLFVADARVLGVTELGVRVLAAGWPRDIPLLVAWLVLVAALIACSVMDLIWYVVDTRITDVALLAGLVLCALWPRGEFFVDRAATPGSAAAVVTFIVSVVMLWRTTWRASSEDDEELALTPTEGEAGVATSSPFEPATVISIAAIVGLAIWLLAASAVSGSPAAGAARLAVPGAFLALFVAMVLTGGQPRDVDDELREAIEAEAPASRGVALRELLWLTPAAVAGGIAYVLVSQVPAIGSVWAGVARWAPIGQLTPAGGAAFAIHGAIVGAAAGWIVRIFFTLAFGREAFGTGDIYILAAAGAVGGWDIALLGFLLSVFIALLGWILGLLLKRPGMIPFGPPLAIGFLLALWLNRGGAERADSLCRDFAQIWRTQPQMALMLIGMMLVVLPVSIFLAKLTRRLVEPTGEQSGTSGGDSRE